MSLLLETTGKLHMRHQIDPKLGNKFSSTNQPKHNGRHKGKSPATCLRELMNENIPYLNPITGCKEVDAASYACAIKWLVAWLQDGDVRAGQEIMERIDGKVAQKILGEGIIPIIQIINYARKQNTDTGAGLPASQVAIRDFRGRGDKVQDDLLAQAKPEDDACNK
jgi:hypothetical protein